MKKSKKTFDDQSEEAVAKYWNTHSLTDADWARAERVVFPNLKPSSQPITIRLPKFLINDFKVKANKLDVPYQSLMKQALAKGLMML